MLYRIFGCDSHLAYIKDLNMFFFSTSSCASHIAALRCSLPFSISRHRLDSIKKYINGILFNWYKCIAVSYGIIPMWPGTYDYMNSSVINFNFCRFSPIQSFFMGIATLGPAQILQSIMGTPTWLNILIMISVCTIYTSIVSWSVIVCFI